MVIVARDLRSSAVAREIEAEIDSGRLGAGRQLPPEESLVSGSGSVASPCAAHSPIWSAVASSTGMQVAARSLQPASVSVRSLTSFTELGAQRGLVASALVLDAHGRREHRGL